MDENVNPDRQTMLKALHKFERAVRKTLYGLLHIMTFLCLIGTVYFGILAASGKNTGGRFASFLTVFLALAASDALASLFIWSLKKALKKQLEFDPASMTLPPKGSVTLDNALRQMTLHTGLIWWDGVFGILLAIMALLTVFVGGDLFRCLLACLILAALLTVGHFFFTWRWKKRSFTKKLLKYTGKYIRISGPEEFAAALEESLKKGVLYYAPELVLTDEFIIGNAGTQLGVETVAIPRVGITDFIYYCKRPVASSYHKYDMGVLKCRMYGGQSVEFQIGQALRMLRIPKMLSYYQIPFKEEETIYV